MYALPSEIWVLVFQALVDCEGSPYPLLRVSRAWRKMAMDSSKLWTRLVLDREKHFLDFSYAIHFLFHSRSRPLDVRITSRETLDITRGITSLLRDHVARFRSLHITTLSYMRAETIIFFMGRGIAAPLLEQLKIRILELDPHFSRHVPPIKDSFTPSPRLTHLVLPPYGIRELFGGLRFSTVTSLILEDQSFEPPSIWSLPHRHNLINFLRSLPQLQSFQLKTGRSSLPYFPTAMNRSLIPNLKSIDIPVPGFGLSILLSLDVPLLTDMRWSGFPESLFHHVVSGLILRHSNSISPKFLSLHYPLVRFFELNRIRMLSPIDDWLWLLSDMALPNLEVLRVDDSDLTDAVLRRAKHNLRRLELIRCSNISGEALLDFVEGCKDDFELMVRDCNHVEADDIAKLSTLVKMI